MDLISRKIRKYAPKGYVTLQKVRKITEEDMGANPKWVALQAGYESVENNPNSDWMHYLLQSLLNSIIYQERIFFVLSRDAFRKDILQKDCNWSKIPGFKNNKWTVFTDYLEDEGILKHYNKGTNNTKIYEVIDEEVLSYLEVDRNKQIEETEEYASNNSELEGDELGDELGDQEDRSKKVEVRESESKTISFEQLRCAKNRHQNKRSILLIWLKILNSRRVNTTISKR